MDPEKRNSRGPLLDHIDALEARCAKEGDPTLQEIVNAFGPDGHYVSILFLTLPFLQPIPMFGLSSIFGVLIAVIGVFAYIQKPPWIPKTWATKPVSSQAVLRIAEGSERILEKLSFMIHPRWPIFLKGPFRILNVVLLIMNAILLALPLPIPFSNAIPAWMILLHTLGHLEEDGLFVVLSYVQTVVCLTYFGLIAKGAGVGMEMLLF